MSDFGKFEKELVDKLNEHHLDKDYHNLWSRLEPTLPKKKRRYFFIWFIGLAFLLIGGIYELTLRGLNRANEVSLKLDDEQFVDPLMNSDISIIVSNKEVNPTSELEKINIVNQTTIQSPKSVAEISNLEKQSPSGLVVHSNLNVSDSREHNSITSAREKVDEINSRNYYERNEIQEFSLPDFSIGNQALISNELTTVTSIHRLRPHVIKVSDDYFIEAPLHLDQDNQVKNKALKIKYGVELLAGNFVDKGNFSNSLTHLENSISPLLTVETGVFVSFNLSPSFSLGLTGRYLQYIEQYEYQNVTVSNVIIENDEAFYVNGTYLSANQEVTFTTEYDILKYNRLSLYALSPMISFYPLKQKKLGLDLHCSIVLSQDYSGTLLGQNLTLETSGSILNNRKLSVLNPGFGLSYPVLYKQLKSKLLLRYQNSQLNSSHTRHNYSLGLRFEL